MLILFSAIRSPAATIVDTGPGVSSGPGGGSCLCYDQWLGAEFTVDRTTTITQVEGWIQGLDGMTVQIRTGFDRPGPVVHEMEYSGPFSDQYRWFGPGGLGWVLRPGKYWVVFGVQQPGSGGGMANNSPRPLGREAHSIGPGGGTWSVSNNLNFGIRILGETSAPTVSFENAQTFIHATNGMAELRIMADSGRTAPVVVTVRRLPVAELPEASFQLIIQPYQNLVSIPHGPLTRSADFVLESADIKVAEPSRVTAVYPPPRIWLCCDSVDVSANGSFATFLHTDVRVRTNLLVRGNLFDASNRLIEPVFFAMADGAGPVIPISWTNRNLVRGGRLTLTGVEGQNGASVMTQHVATLLPYVEPLTVSFSAPKYDFTENGFGTVTATLSRPFLQAVNVGVRQTGGSSSAPAIGVFSFPSGAVIAHLQLALPEAATLQLETGAILAGEHPTTEIAMAPARAVLVSPDPPLAQKGRTVDFRVYATRLGVERTIEFFTRDLAAVAGRDYIPTNGTLRITNNPALISIPVPENAVGGLSFQLVLTNAKNVVFPATNLTVTILSTPTFSQAVFFADENGEARVQVQLENAMPFPVPFTIQVERDRFSREFAFDFPAGRTNEELKLPLGDAARHVHELTLASAARSQSAWVMPFGSTTNTSEIIVRPGPIRPGDIATITFERRGNVSKPMFFTWATEDGTARAGIDYRASQNALFFNRGERTAEIHLEIFQSDAMEPRSFSLVISDSSDPETYFTNVKTDLTIPSEIPGIVLWDSEKFTIENAEAAEMYFYSGRTGDFEYFTADGTARAGFDYVQSKGTLTNVPDGSVRVPLIDDTVVEPVKYFTFHVVQTAPVRSTNSIKVYISDNELGSVRDSSFKLEESEFSQSGWAVLPDDRIIELWDSVARIFSQDGALVATRHLEFLENVNVDWSQTGLGLDGSVAVVPPNWENKVSGTTPIYRISTDTLQEQKIEIEAGFYRVLAAAFLPGGSIMIARAHLLNDRWELVRLHPNGTLDISYPIYTASLLPNERISRIQVWQDRVVQIRLQFCNWGCSDSAEMLIHEGKVIRATERAIYPEQNRWLLPDGRILVRVSNSIRGGYELARHNADGTLDPDFASSLLDGYNTTYVGAQSDGSVIVWSSDPFQNGAAQLLRLRSSPALQANVLVSGVDYPRAILEGQTGQLTVYRAGNSAVSLPFRINVTNSQGQPAARFDSLDRIFQIPAGQSFLHVSFAPIEDRIGKPPETFILSAEPLAAGVAVGGAEMLVQVLDNDPGVALSATRQPFTIMFNQFAHGTTYDIEASDDLVTWSALSTRTGSTQWHETPSLRARFYRARLK